ncbi:unnamed protein product [Arabis nemorensis]|uniref:Uncharacterized protein n=1 Tax=Arabis nemorensis TaxID=586526 RepID=A0A565C9K4_9BRAS|nr:unnamed protein product [Arabis nemorensis]
MANRSRVITMSSLDLNQEDDLVIDLDLWEVVNPSDGEYSDDSFSVDSLSDDDVISLDDASLISPSVISPPPSPLPPQMLVVADDGGDLSLAADLDLDGHVDGDDEVFRDEIDDDELGSAQRRMLVLRRGTTRYSFGITYGDFANRGGGCCYDDGEEDRGEDDGEYDDSYDLDEELVPRSVTKELGKQRMRKLGKKSIAKVPYSLLKPGCVRPGGKHGLGMKLRF